MEDSYTSDYLFSEDQLYHLYYQQVLQLDIYNLVITVIFISSKGFVKLFVGIM